MPHRRDFLAATAALPTAAFLQSISAAAEGDEKLPIGMNLSGVSDYQAGFPFVNQMWGARPWLTRQVGGGGAWDSGKQAELPLDADGYPLEVPFSTADGSRHDVFTILPNRGQPGRYVLLYGGEGKIEGAMRTKVIVSKPGRLLLEMTHGGDDGNLEVVRIVESRRGNHVRNIRIVAEEYENRDLGAEPFLPEVVEYCRQFHTLRFMDWLGTNDSVNSAWEARKRPSFFTQVGVTGDAVGLHGESMPAWQRRYASGVAVELCIAMANAALCDAWLCVPHLADDGYIRGMAELTKERLDPRLKVYVEHSNEVWNWQFQQSQWNLQSRRIGELAEAAGVQAWEESKTPQFNEFGVATNRCGANHPERLGVAARRVHAIWEQVFTGEDRKRLVRVAAGQASWRDVSERCLKTAMRLGGCDAFSVAGYFGPDDGSYNRWEAKGGSLTAEDVIADMRRVIDEDTRPWCEDTAGLCKQHGVRFVCYEGGQHIQPKGQQATAYMPALGAAQRHPAMADLYRRLLEIHTAAGCDLFCAFASVSEQGSRYGSWGHSESYMQPPSEAPKLRALLETNAAKR